MYLDFSGSKSSGFVNWRRSHHGDDTCRGENDDGASKLHFHKVGIGRNEVLAGYSRDRKVVACVDRDEYWFYPPVQDAKAGGFVGFIPFIYCPQTYWHTEDDANIPTLITPWGYKRKGLGTSFRTVLEFPSDIL